MKGGIVDAHHHVWRQADLAWLMGPMQPRIFGPYEAIRRDYPIAEYLDDIAGTGVDKSVYVQANWPKERFEDEVAWVQGVADRTGWPHGIVGYADLTVDDVRPQLDRLAAYPLMRGVRMQLHWHANAMFRFAPRPDVMRDAAFRTNVARLADYGWTFDLQVFAGQMTDAARLAADVPRVSFILQHAGMLEDTSESGLAEWRAGLARLAAQPNVFCKLSGLGTFVHALDAGAISAIVGTAMSLFGADRCLFGSNFPIEKLWTGYPALVRAYRQALGGYSPADQAAAFRTTAQKVYRLDN